jgi:CRISPR/Cas system CMR subunit Cmr4 (Cas7 group RAMP superfamily)
MNQITTKQFIDWCYEDKDAAASLLSVSINKLDEMLKQNQKLDSYSNRLAIYLISQYSVSTKEDVLRIALHRTNSKLERICQIVKNLDPLMDL